jgi:hypothetical protein
MNLLRHFIIGGSFPVISTFYYGVYHMQPKKNYSYFNYTLIAPLYFGLFNILIHYFGNKYQWSLKKRYLIFTFISYLTTISYATKFKSYNFSQREWYKYYIYLIIKYLIIWNFVVINIEKNM